MTTLTIQISNNGKTVDLVSAKIFCADGDNDTTESKLLNKILSQAKVTLFNHDYEKKLITNNKALTTKIKESKK
jgi:hypothetical protein